MGDFVQKPGTGALFKNDKDGNDARPDYKGDLTLESGEKVRIAGWIKDGAKGKFMSLKVDKPQDDRAAVKSDGPGSGAGVRAGYDNHGRGQDAGRRVAYDDLDSPF